MTRSDAIAAVMARVDEVTTSAGDDVALASDALVKPVSEYAEKLLDEATDAVLKLASTLWLPKSIFDADIVNLVGAKEGGVAFHYFEMPDNFLRLVYILEKKVDDDGNVTGWHVPVHSVIEPESEAYRIVRNEHTTAGVSRPVVALTSRWSGTYKLCLELYGLRDESTDYVQVSGQYVPKTYFEEYADNTFYPLVEDAIVWKCAYAVLSVMGRSEALKTAQGFVEEAVMKIRN